MRPEIFLRCLRVVFQNEGLLSDDSFDPGGLTFKGITQAVYDSYRAKNGDSFQSVGMMTDEECDDIYFSLYWSPMNLEVLLNDDLILDVFDHGVNTGIRTSIKLLQRLVGVGDDGFIGEQTSNAVQGFNGDIVEEFKKRRKLFYVTLAQQKPQLRKFLKGWINRVDNTKF